MLLSFVCIVRLKVFPLSLERCLSDPAGDKDIVLRPLVCLRALKAATGHEWPLLIVVKRQLCNMEHKPDSAAEGKWLSQGALKAAFRGHAAFGAKWFTVMLLCDSRLEVINLGFQFYCTSASQRLHLISSVIYYCSQSWSSRFWLNKPLSLTWLCTVGV